MPPILWKPSKAFIENANLRDFEHWLGRQKNLHFSDYQALWEWSANNPAAFWESIWQYFDIISHAPYRQVLSGSKMPDVHWFEGATLNYAEHIFRQYEDRREQTALWFASERQAVKAMSWGELADKVLVFKQFLEKQGIGKGDRVAAYLPNTPEALIAFYAVNALGAVWSCCSPDFGVNTVIDRFVQIEPKLFIAVDGYQYGGKSFDRRQEVLQIHAQLPTVEHTVFFQYLDAAATCPIPNATNWTEALQANPAAGNLQFTPVPFEHPIWILYSSGTTGKPKAITHSHGGVLLEHYKYMAFHNDVHPGENFFWFSTTGWMMWNFLQASLLMGAAPVLYDGSPGYPGLEVLWQLAGDLPIHHFGTSAPYLVACMKKGLSPKSLADLSSLRSIGSTGAPLPPEAFDWVYQDISDNIWLCSMSGGTDVCTAFVGGNPYAPVYRGRIQCRALGCALEAYNDEGQPVTGSLGEMVIEQPMPSMPVFFWNDPGGKRYRESYFETYPGKWRHGDWVEISEDGSLTIQGRSDATLNRKGVRIGTAEIYSVLDGIPGIKDSVILNLELDGGDDFMPLFIVLDPEKDLDEALKNQINTALKQQCSPRHVPDHIFQIPDIPYTLSGKKMEVPVKKILMGISAGAGMNKDAVRNPEAMAFFEKWAPDFRMKYLK